MNNIEAFNLITGKLFAELYQEFPSFVEIDYFGLCLDLMPKDDYNAGFEKPEFSKATVKWLADAGYIWLKKSSVMHGKPTATLSPKGLEALKAIPEKLEPKTSLGEKIIKYTKEKANDSLSQAVSLAISYGFKLITQNT